MGFDRDKPVEAIIAEMTLEEKVGQLLMVTFDGATVNGEAKKLLRDYHVGAFVLVGPNIKAPAQVAQLTRELQELAGKEPLRIPLLIAIDHEGGAIVRFTDGVTFFPSNMALGATRSADYAYQEGRIAGEELRAMGINMNLAPVLDVNDNPINPVIGLRSYGDSADLVSSLGVSYIKGLQESGVMATAKHFPGHGNTGIDSHAGLPVVDKNRAALDQVELRPFRDAIATGVAAVMSAHVAYPSLDPGSFTPATLSPKIISGVLREEMGYEGLVLSDSMDMGAITKQYGTEEAAIRAVQAGIDMLLVPWSLELQTTVYQALVQAVKTGMISEERINESVARILSAKQKYATLPPGDVEEVGSADHQDVANKISEEAITLVNKKELIPLKLGPAQKILVVSPSPLPAGQRGTLLGDYIADRHPSSAEVVISIYDAATRDQAATRVLELVEQHDVVIVSTWYAGPWQEELVKDLLATGRAVIVIALGGPYDLARFPEVNTYLTTYGILASQLQAVARVIFGEIPARGELPVSIPGFPN